jgi:hypothetical protein
MMLWTLPFTLLNTSNIHGLRLAIVFSKMKEEPGLTVAALNESIGMLQQERKQRITIAWVKKFKKRIPVAFR